MQRRRTQATRELVLQALRSGATRAAASAHAGISYPTLWRWCQESETFRDAVTQAEGQAELAMSATISQSARRGSWQAALAWLERRRPDEWARIERIELVIRREAKRIADQTGLDEEELVAEAERIIGGRS